MKDDRSVLVHIYKWINECISLCNCMHSCAIVRKTEPKKQGKWLLSNIFSVMVHYNIYDRQREHLENCLCVFMHKCMAYGCGRYVRGLVLWEMAMNSMQFACVFDRQFRWGWPQTATARNNNTRMPVTLNINSWCYCTSVLLHIIYIWKSVFDFHLEAHHFGYSQWGPIAFCVCGIFVLFHSSFWLVSAHSNCHAFWTLEKQKQLEKQKKALTIASPRYEREPFRATDNGKWTECVRMCCGRTIPVYIIILARKTKIYNASMDDEESSLFVLLYYMVYYIILLFEECWLQLARLSSTNAANALHYLYNVYVYRMNRWWQASNGSWSVCGLP